MQSSPPPTPTLNVLFAVLEDFGTAASPVFSRDVPDSAGSTRRHTPHLQRLAARGVTFQRTYCQAPICNPSRTSFLTSRRPGATGVFTNDDLKFPKHLPTLIDFIKSSGSGGGSSSTSSGSGGGSSSARVACTGRGKIFHIACDVEPHGFEDGSVRLANDVAFRRHLEGNLYRALNSSSAAGTRGSSSSSSSSRRRHSALIRTLHASESARTRDQEKASIAALLLAHYAETRERFFLAVGLASTHVHGGHICIPNAVSAEGGRPLGPRALLPPTRDRDRDAPLVTWPNWDLTHWDRLSKRQLPRFDFDQQAQREAIGQYYACATHVDAQIGALIDALDVLKLAPTTAFVVQGDHGFSLGRHGRWSKYHLYEDATRVPLIMAVPGGAAGRVVDDVVESLDVMPTLLDLWGAPRGSSSSDGSDNGLSPTTTFRLGNGGVAIPLDGTSLLPYLQQQTPPAPAGLRPTYARSELREWMVVHRANDTLLPGARPMRMVGRGAQLYVRTARYAYVAYFRPRCGCKPGLLLVDEQLFDHSIDKGEATNLAYNPLHASTRQQLLSIVLRDWKVDVAGSTHPDRNARSATLAQLASCFNRSAPSCPSGAIVGALR